VFMSKATIIRGAVIVQGRTEVRADLLIENSMIAAIGSNLDVAGALEVDASGCLLLPGIIDAHVQFGIHYRDTVASDDFERGSLAASAGGVTTFIDFAVPAKGTPPLDALVTRLQEAEGKVSTDFTLHQAITDSSPRFLDQIIEVINRGIKSFKIYMTYSNRGRMITPGELEAIMRRVGPLGGIVEVHAEDDSIVVRRTADLLGAGKTDIPSFPSSRPAVAEIIAVHSAIALAEQTGCPLYVHHSTTAGTVDLIAGAKRHGVSVFGETCPPYLIFDESVYQQDDGYLYIVNPSIKGTSDRQRLWRGIQDGSIDVIGTDHCGYTLAQKSRQPDNFDATPAGFPGVETLLPFMYTKGVCENKISIYRMLELISENPAKIFGLFPRKGTITIGSDADLVIFDPAPEWTVHPEGLHMSPDYNPFTGMTLRGRVRHTFLRGHHVYAEGEFLETHTGQFIPFVD
jgi:dihydropyrimidinase